MQVQLNDERRLLKSKDGGGEATQVSASKGEYLLWEAKPLFVNPSFWILSRSEVPSTLEQEMRCTMRLDLWGYTPGP